MESSFLLTALEPLLLLSLGLLSSLPVLSSFLMNITQPGFKYSSMVAAPILQFPGLWKEKGVFSYNLRNSKLKSVLSCLPTRMSTVRVLIMTL